MDVRKKARKKAERKSPHVVRVTKMTRAKISDFYLKISKAQDIERRGKHLLEQSWDLTSKARLSCDHRNPDGKIAGHKFDGSYCGFMCSICGGSVSYESMGH